MPFNPDAVMAKIAFVITATILVCLTKVRAMDHADMSFNIEVPAIIKSITK
ncbi:MAG: hypothetical protein HOE90_18520 [Bacteriovoracaceae bacterium]|nr:hypothetical protein [Bacteriovoracaceae bacterium]